MTRWDSDRTVDRMASIMHPERKKKQDGPFGAVMEALVPASPKGNNNNASKKSKRRVQVRKSGKRLQTKGKSRSTV